MAINAREAGDHHLIIEKMLVWQCRSRVERVGDCLEPAGIQDVGVGCERMPRVGNRF